MFWHYDGVFRGIFCGLKWCVKGCGKCGKNEEDVQLGGDHQFYGVEIIPVPELVG